MIITIYIYIYIYIYIEDYLIWLIRINWMQYQFYDLFIKERLHIINIYIQVCFYKNLMSTTLHK